MSEKETKIPRPYVVSSLSIIVALVFSLIAVIYNTATGTAAADIQRQETEIATLRQKNEAQDASISKLAESSAALAATLNTVLPQINSRLDRIDRKIP